MRVSTPQFHQKALQAILDQQAQLLRIQNEVATQRRVINPSDDPVAITNINNLQRQINLSERWLSNANLVENYAQQEETALSGAKNIIVRVKELLLQGVNGSYSAQERESLAVEMEARLEELVQIANTQVNGTEYLFAGFRTDVPPVSRDISGQFVYNGDQGRRFLDVGASVDVAMSDDGYAVFFDIFQGNGDFETVARSTNTGTGIISPGSVSDPGAYVPDDYEIRFALSGNQLVFEVFDSANNSVSGPTTYQEGADIQFNGITVNISGTPQAGDVFEVNRSQRQDIFTTIQQAIDTMRMASSTEAEKALFRDSADNVLENLDNGFDRINQVLGRIGGRLNVIDNERQVNQDFIANAQIALSGERDVDMADAISRLQQHQLGLEAAQRSFALIQNLSLFNFL